MTSSLLSATGTLHLIPTPLDFGCPEDRALPIADVLPASALAQAATLSHWVVEHAKSARAFLRRVHHHTPLKHSLQELHISELPRALHKLGDFPKQGHLAEPLDKELKALLAPCLPHKQSVTAPPPPLPVPAIAWLLCRSSNSS